MSKVTLKGEVLAEILRANPKGRIKSVEYGSFGEVRKVEWYDDPPCAAREEGADTQ